MGHYIVDDDPSDHRLFIPNIEFYITNVCNLTCSNCNRFNDHNFRGWQRWSDYESVYQEWASRIRLQRITILGGEPLLNPTLTDWVRGINTLWGKSVQVLTNGTHLNKVPDLYSNLVGFVEKTSHARNWIGVSLHNPNDRERCFDNIRQFLQGPVKYVHRDDPDNANNAYTMGGDHAFLDSNGMRVCVWEYQDFYTSAIQKTPAGRFTVHNSDPVEAHSQCGFAMFKCYHFIRGAIYKCGPVALFPEFDQQHQLDISDQDRELINSYQPLTVDQFDQRGQQFMADIDNPIPQCKFCPTKFSMTKLFAVSKKAGSVSGYDVV